MPHFTFEKISINHKSRFEFLFSSVFQINPFPFVLHFSQCFCLSRSSFFFSFLFILVLFLFSIHIDKSNGKWCIDKIKPEKSNESERNEKIKFYKYSWIELWALMNPDIDPLFKCIAICCLIVVAECEYFLNIHTTILLLLKDLNFNSIKRPKIKFTKIISIPNE